MRDKIITIYGGTGFVGRSVVRRLAKLGCRIRVATRSESEVNRLKVCGDVGQITPVCVDLLYPETLEAALENSDFVLNFIGSLYEKGKMTFDLLHHQTPKTIAQYAQKHNIQKLVHISALGADPASNSVYAKTKAAGEAAVLNAFPKATLLRPSVIFGPDDRFFNRFAQMATYAPCLTVFDGGHTKLQPVYVGDVADAVVKVLEDKTCDGQTYELGGPRVYSIRDLMHLILSMIKRDRPVVSLPSGIGSLIGYFGEFLPEPPLTRDQIKLLATDSVVCGQAKGFKELGITPGDVELIVPEYLKHYQPRF